MDTPLYHTAHLHQLSHRLAQVVQAIASAPEGAVLFHCGAGWDRTGLAAAFLLKAIGVTEDAAVAAARRAQMVFPRKDRDYATPS